MKESVLVVAMRPPGRETTVKTSKPFQRTRNDHFRMKVTRFKGLLKIIISKEKLGGVHALRLRN